MISVRVTHTLDDLQDDLRGIAVRAPKDIRGVVRDGVKAGNMLAKENALRTSGTHGGPPKGHYIRSMSWEMSAGAGLFGNTISGEYGPVVGKKQGSMSFEFGSRNQKPHLDLAKSADIIGPALAQEIRALPGKWFW